MSFQIGSKYEETKARLKQEIADGTITFVQGLSIGYNLKGFQCIFCKKHIDEKVSSVILLIDKIENGFSVYPADERCFRQAQLNFYYNEIPFSIN